MHKSLRKAGLPVEEVRLRTVGERRAVVGTKRDAWKVHAAQQAEPDVNGEFTTVCGKKHYVAGVGTFGEAHHSERCRRCEFGSTTPQSWEPFVRRT